MHSQTLIGDLEYVLARVRMTFGSAELGLGSGFGVGSDAIAAAGQNAASCDDVTISEMYNSRGAWVLQLPAVVCAAHSGRLNEFEGGNV